MTKPTKEDLLHILAWLALILILGLSCGFVVNEVLHLFAQEVASQISANKPVCK